MKTKKLQLRKLKVANLNNSFSIKGGVTTNTCDISVYETLCPELTCDYTTRTSEDTTCEPGTVETRTGDSLLYSTFVM